MIGAKLRFPAIDAWQQMSESEQDALLTRMETARWRDALLYRLLVAMTCTAVGASIGMALLNLW